MNIQAQISKISGLILCWLCMSWGFFGHQTIHRTAIFLLPPPQLGFYKKHATYLESHATDPDKRRYVLAGEAPRHYIDIDHYGNYPWPDLPRQWDSAVRRYSYDTLVQYGIAPWYIPQLYRKLIGAFRKKDAAAILKISADLGHYVSDIHVPLHVCSNHNGQHSGQIGIHGFWESRVPELLANEHWDFWLDKAQYIPHVEDFIWQRVMESGLAADTVLREEANLTRSFGKGKYAFEERNGHIVEQYSQAFTKAYDAQLGGMVERRMRASIHAVASIWYSAWIEAGQPDLQSLTLSTNDMGRSASIHYLDSIWRAVPTSPRPHE